MKKFSIALISLLLCFIMAFGAFAVDAPVEATPVTSQETSTSAPFEDVFESAASSVIADHEQEVGQITGVISNLSATITKMLDALDKFLRSFGVVVNQILDKVFNGGNLPF